MPDAQFTFTGELQKKRKNPHPDSPRFPEPYIASADLVEAVNLALFLRRPFLLEGEPGCGKTRLAYAVAYELGLPFYRWDIRSRSQVVEGLYIYDATRRLYDAQLAPMMKENRGGVLDPSHYVALGPIGRAFMYQQQPAVVLIDEIDKADTDFPSDLLAILDEPWAFSVIETGQIIQAAHRPIVFITNNQKKDNLGESFIRRCIYHFIRFPDKQQVRQIAQAHYTDTSLPEELLAAATERFIEMRDQSELRQKPGIREFLDWLALLHAFGSKPYSAQKLIEESIIPYQGAVLKSTKTYTVSETGDSPQASERKVLIELRKAISARFSAEELRTLCFDLGISYDALTGEGDEGKVRELVAYFHRRGRIHELIGFIKLERPDIPL